MPALRRIAVVGASLAGLRAVEALRAGGYDGRLFLIGDEPEPPYNRPPLSKQFLTSDDDVTAITLPARDGLDLDWRLGTRATTLRPHERRLDTTDGPVSDLDAVILATGAHAGGLDLPVLDGIHTLRTVADAISLRRRLGIAAHQSERVAVLGAGLIGCEVAGTCRSLGLDVTLVDPADRLMSRALPPQVSQLMAVEHRRAGVDLRLETSVVAVYGDRQVERLDLTDGARLDIGALIVAVGSRPATGWLAGSGLDLTDGVLTDEHCLAPGTAGRVAAIGDVCRAPDAAGGPATRGEHWSRAVDQAGLAARTLLHGPSPATPPPPFFWSEQHGRRLQVVGNPHDATSNTVEHTDHGWAVSFHNHNGQLVGLAALDLPGRVAAARRFLQAPAGVDLMEMNQ